jgi:hypothetical protein
MARFLSFFLVPSFLPSPAVWQGHTAAFRWDGVTGDADRSKPGRTASSDDLPVFACHKSGKILG